MSNKRVVLSAAYGLGNIGDEAICDVILNDIVAAVPDSMITVLVFDTQLFLSAHPAFSKDTELHSILSMQFSMRDLVRLSSWARAVRILRAIQTADYFIWGGGGIVRNRIAWLKKYIRPLKIAIFFRVPVYVYCIGVDTLSRKDVLEEIQILRSAKVVTVRDEYSAANLRLALGAVSELYTVPDPAYRFDLRASYPVRSEPHAQLRVGLNIALWKADMSDAAHVAQFVDAVSQELLTMHRVTPFTLLHLPTAPMKDSHVFSLIAKKIQNEIPYEEHVSESAYEFCNKLASLDVLIASRLHAVILATTIPHLPIVSVAYDEKVEALHAQLSPHERCSYQELLSPGCLSRKVRDTIHTEPSNFARESRAESMQSRLLLARFFNS